MARGSADVVVGSAADVVAGIEPLAGSLVALALSWSVLAHAPSAMDVRTTTPPRISWLRTVQGWVGMAIVAWSRSLDGPGQRS
jgi:hypothetical protein